jgi:hypothetical protein
MRKAIFLAVIVLFGAAVAAAATFGQMDLKVGDQVYACNCGESCPCQTMAKMPGKCTCGSEMVKAQVTKVEDGSVMLKSDSWQTARSFKTTGKYACACGADCMCEAVSQNPGKCPCGEDMKKVE